MPSRARRWTWWAVRLGALLLAVAVLLVVIVHTSPVRRAVLRRAIATLQEQFNLRLDADRLDYNLFTLRVSLTNVRVASMRDPQTPFLVADRIVVAVPRSALFGPLRIASLVADHARVHVVRRADGSTNLPPSAATSDTEPEPLRIEWFAISHLALQVDDAPSGMRLDVPSMALEIGRERGRVGLERPARLTRGRVETMLRRLDGSLTFDGRTLTLDRLAVASDEITAAVNGSVGILVRDPSVDLTLSAGGDVRRLARWAVEGDVPQGSARVDAHIAGPFGAVVVDGTVRSAALAWQGLTISDVRSNVRITPERLVASRAQAVVAGGVVGVDADVPFGDGPTTVDAEWRDVRLHQLTRVLAPEFEPRPSARATGRLSARGPGFDVERWTGDLRTDLRAGPNAPSEVATGGRMTVALRNGAWQMDGRLVAAAVAPVNIALAGELDASHINRSTMRGRLHLADTDLPSAIRALRDTRLLDVDPALLERGVATGHIALSGTFDEPNVQVRVDAREVNVAGLQNVAVEGAARGTLERLTFDASVRQPENVVVASGSVFPHGRRVELRGEGHLANLTTLTDGVPVGGTADLRFEAEGPVDAIRARGTVTVREARYDRIALGHLHTTIDVDGATARIQATLNDFAARGDATIALSAPHASTIDLVVDDLDVARAVRGIDMPAPLAGHASLTAHAEGMLDQWRRGRVDINVQALNVTAGDLPVRLVAPGRVGYGGETFAVENIDLLAGETHISIGGRLPAVETAPPVADVDALRATVTGDLAQALSAIAATRVITLPSIEGRGPVALLARATGSAERPILAADLELGPGELATGDLPPATNVQLRAQLRGDDIVLRDATGEWQGSRLNAHGRLPVRFIMSRQDGSAPSSASSLDADRATFTARVSAITPRVLEPFLEADTLAQIDGTVDASLQLDTPSLELEDVRGEMRLERFDMRIAGLPVTQRVPTRIAASGGFARVEAWEWTGQGATFGVQGQVRLADRESALLTSGSFDLRMLTPFLRDVGLTTAGRLEPRLSITGPIDNPRIDGDARLTAGEARLVDPRVVATDLNARAVLTRTSARLIGLSGSVNGGTLTGGGQLEYGPDAPLSAQLTADVRGMAMDFPEGLRSELNAAIGISVLSTDEGPSGRVSGTVTVLRGAYREPLAVATGLLAALRSGRVAAEAAPEAASLMDRLALDVRVLTEDDIVVDNNYGRLQLGADLRVIGTAGVPSLSGRATLREGGQLFLGRNVYTIDSGTIDFANPDTVEPDLNISARTRAGGEEIDIAMRGTPDTLQVDLSSPNTFLGHADLASLLLTGRTLDEVSGAEAQIVGEQVIGYFSADVLGLASRAVGLDTLRLGGINDPSVRTDPTAVATELDPTSRLTFGKSIGRQVDVTLSQSLREGDRQTWIVDYTPRQQLQLRLVSNDEELRSYEFRHDLSFGAAADRQAVASAVGTDGDRRVERVSAVTFTGDLVLPERRVRDVLQVGVGEPFDFSDWQRERDRLERLYHDAGYREARISARRDEQAGAVALAYAVDAGPQTSIVVNGRDLPRDVLGRIELAWTRSVFDDFLREEAEAIVRDALAREGYLRASVTAAVTTDASGKTLTITVAPGERSVERVLRFEGVDDALRQQLERWVDTRDLRQVAWTNPAGFERELTANLRAQGRLRSKVMRGAPLFEGERAILPISVEAGPVFTVAEIRFEGQKGIAADRLHDAAALAPGAPYDSAAVDAARSRVTALYRREAFTSARVSTRQAIDDVRSRVVVTFAVQEGPRQVISGVTVHGNRAIDQDVIARALDLEPNQPVRAEDWLQARKRLFATGLFRRVDVAAEPIVPGPAQGDVQPMRARVTVQEWPALRVRYGFQLAEERPEGEVEGRDLVPGLSADITRRTVFGRAVTLGGAFQYQRRERLGRAFANAPTLFGKAIESSLALERSREEFAAALITDKSGASWEQRTRLVRNLRLSYGYRFERNHTFKTAARDDPFAFDITVNVARLNGAAAWDTRDDAADTTRGSLLSASFDYAPEALGSDIRFVRYLAQAYHFRPWRRIVFASAARLGLAAALGGQDLIPSERFFAGGARTVRGVRDDGLGPRDVLDEPIGGEALLVLNEEIRFPIYRWLRGVTFVDAGNVFTSPSALDFGDLVRAVGVGLRLSTPFALLRIDYGRRSSQAGRWYFGIGHSF